jgi:hypothetical protein
MLEESYIRPYKITYLILIPARPNFYRPPQRILLLLRVRSSDPLPNNKYASILMRKNKMPPPVHNFLEKGE